MGTRVGLVGLGLLGSAFARVLGKAGFELRGFDILEERQREAEGYGVQRAGSAREVAEASEVVLTALPSEGAVARAIAGEEGVLRGARPGLTVAEMSTISPAFAREMHLRAKGRGVALLDAPVSGTSAMVARGDCILMVGGEREAFERALPVLGRIGRRVTYLGPSGQGAQLKLVTNLIMGGNTAVLAEGFALARKAGIDPKLFFEVLAPSAAGSKMLEVRGPLMAEGRFEPQMKVELFLKDLRLILENGKELGAALPLTAAARELFARTAALGRGGEDMAAVVCAFGAGAET